MSKLSWKQYDNILVAREGNQEVKSFDLTLLFDLDLWSKFTQVQKKIIGYGVRQKLADSVAGKKSLGEKLTGMEDMWNMLLEGQWERQADRRAYREEIEKYKAEIEELRRQLEQLKNKG